MVAKETLLTDAIKQEQQRLIAKELAESLASGKVNVDINSEEFEKTVYSIGSNLNCHQDSAELLIMKMRMVFES